MHTVPIGAGGAIPRPLFRAPKTCARRVAIAAVLTLCLGYISTATADPVPSSATIGHASWYGGEFADRLTASGERFDPTKLTGAHRTLPLGTVVRVTNLLNGRSVLVTINDRGPYMRQRAIDLSYGAARAIGMIQRGVARVRIELVES